MNQSYKFTTIAHSTRAHCNPTSNATVQKAFESFTLRDNANVFDAGCGKGEMLIQLAEKRVINGVGVDVNPEFLAIARRESSTRVAHGSVVFVESSIEQYPLADKSIDALFCVGSTHVFGGLKETLNAASRMLRHGGVALIGEGFWRRRPDRSYLELLDATVDDFNDHAGNIETGIAAGFRSVASLISSDEEWDDYEHTYAANVLSYIAANPDDPDIAAMHERITTWNNGYQRWGRTTLGFGLYVLQKE